MVIVGAGLSGLVSALHLLDMEVTSAASITVLDGRKRVGGRLLAHQGVDVGGAWCWTSSHHDTPVLADRFGVTTFEQYDDGLNVVDYGDSTTRTKQSFDSAKVRFEGGAAAIAVAIADHVREKGVNVLLDCTVNRISTEHGGGVVVEGVLAGAPTSWTAKAVFLAIPPRLILPPLISWEPSLPPALATTAKATPTWMANTTKVLVTYSRPFWRELGMSGNAMSYGGGPIAQLYDSCGPEHGSSKGPYALCGFIFGGAGANDALPDDETLRLQLLDQLERLFGPEAKSFTAFSFHRWGDQPLTSGNGGGEGGGHESMGHRELRNPFGSSAAGGPPRVWLSATETSASYAGLMEGAVLSGRRVVEEAIRQGAFSGQEIGGAEGACRNATSAESGSPS